MFTGIIQTTGTIKAVSQKGNYLELIVMHGFKDDGLNIGDSVACDGACLTVTSIAGNNLTFDVSQETIEKTIAGFYKPGERINLELALRVGDRLGGHFVTGHIDSVASISKVEQAGESVVMEIKFDNRFGKLVVAKGSIAINGVSLTVNETSDNFCSVNLVPHTLQNTNLRGLKVHDKVNIEFDLMGKYAIKTLTAYTTGNLTFDKLTESGW